MHYFNRFAPLIALLVFFSLRLPEMRAETSGISISYGIDGKPPYYTYRLIENPNHHISCELEGAGKIISRKDFVWRSDLQTLWKEIVSDFARAEPENINWTPDNPIRKRVSVSNESDRLRREIAITGTDAISQIASIKHLLSMNSLRPFLVVKSWTVAWYLLKTDQN